MHGQQKKKHNNKQFNSFSCDCDIENIPLTLKNKKHISCILLNYLKFIKHRNLHDILHETYIKAIKRNINFPEMIKNFKLGEIDNDANYKRNNSFLLKIKNKTTQLGEIFEYLALVEFVNFINTHVYISCYQDEIVKATNAYKNITQY